MADTVSTHIKQNVNGILTDLYFKFLVLADSKK